MTEGTTPPFTETQEQRCRRQEAIAKVMVPAVLILIITSAVAAMYLFANAEEKAHRHTAKATIAENGAAIAAELTESALIRRGLSHREATPYVQQAALQELQVNGCRRHSSTKYRYTLTCRLSIHLKNPTRISIDTTHLVEMERAQGFNWAFRRMPVLSQAPGHKAAVETYGTPLP